MIDGEVQRNARHQARMGRKKAVVDAKIAEATHDQGVLLVHTGNGKGKSSAGFGMLARALGHGMRVGVVQFIKGATRPSMACAPRLGQDLVPGTSTLFTGSGHTC
mgnify:CR=1 FL=1